MYIVELLPLIILPLQGIIGSSSFLFSFGVSVSQFVWSILLLLTFKSNLEFQYIDNFLGIEIGIDGCALWFQIQFNQLFPLLFQSNYKNSNWSTLSQFLIHSINFFGNQILISLNIQVFYIAFEAIQIPLIYLIYYYGSRNKKLLAIKYQVIYTFIGSFLVLAGFIQIYNKQGTFNYLIILDQSWLLSDIQYLLWILFFFGFGVKVPQYIFHIWLPLVHTEGNAVGSVILSSIILKQGYLGLLRFNIALCPLASQDWTPFVIIISLLGVLYSVMAALSTLDMKQIIAYSSVIHMNQGNQGLFSNSLMGIACSFTYNMTHGFVSAGLFQIAGFLYDRYKTRIILYYKGLVIILPLLTLQWFIIILSNISFPFTSGFQIEVWLFIILFKVNPYFALQGMTALFLLPAYFLQAYQRMAYGKQSKYILTLYQDINQKEFLILILLIQFIVFIGLKPQLIHNFIEYKAFCLLY